MFIFIIGFCVFFCFGVGINVIFCILLEFEFVGGVFSLFFLDVFLEFVILLERFLFFFLYWKVLLVCFILEIFVVLILIEGLFFFVENFFKVLVFCNVFFLLYGLDLFIFLEFSNFWGLVRLAVFLGVFVFIISLDWIDFFGYFFLKE